MVKETKKVNDLDPVQIKMERNRSENVAREAFPPDPNIVRFNKLKAHVVFCRGGGWAVMEYVGAGHGSQDGKKWHGAKLTVLRDHCEGTVGQFSQEEAHDVADKINGTTIYFS